MTTPNHLTYLIARERIDDLNRSAQEARLAGAAREGARGSRRRSVIAWVAGRLPQRSGQSAHSSPAVAPPGPAEP